LDAIGSEVRTRLDAWVKSQDINAKGKKGEGSPKRMSDMLRQAFKAIDFRKR
jgi:hypothetical protein